MKKNKGFTLIELLAVIVILAIITLITIPIVLNTINNSEKESEKRSVEGYARAIEEDVANYLMMNPGKSYNDYVDEFNKKVENGEEPVDYKGNKVKCEPISINDKGKLILTGCIVYKEGDQLTDEQKAKKNHYNYDGKKVELVQNNNSNNNNNTSTPTTYAEYKIGDEITVAGEQYYVIADSGTNQDYVTALKAEPLTVEEVNTYGANIGLGVMDVQGYGVIRFGATNDYNTSWIKTVINNWAEDKLNSVHLVEIDEYTVRLMKKEEFIMEEFEKCGQYNGSGCWTSYRAVSWQRIDNYCYWTMTPMGNSSSSTFLVFATGEIDGYQSNMTNYSVVRPVINVKKSDIPN